ncbi:MAG TPA: TolC family protein [Kofleriaceae bacterium]|nr:TolC family protein [Kofleriaceae bacterium]
MKSIRSLLFVALVAVPAAAQPPGEAQPQPQTQTLTLARAIELALQQQPSIRQQQANVEAARGRVDQAKVIRKPTVTLNGTVAARSTQGGFVNGVADPSGGFFDPFYSTGLSGNISYRIYDFGLTKANIRAAEANAEAVAAGTGTTTLDVQTNVAVAYLEAVARQRLISVAEATVVSEDAHLDQARRFVAAQAKDPIEQVQAQARASTARSTLAQAHSDAATSLAVLRQTMGLLDPMVAIAVAPEWPGTPAGDPSTLVALVEEARQHRPEIVQLDKQILAAEASVDAARAGSRPVLSAGATMQWNPTQNDWSPDPTWNAGLTLSWPIYDGGRAKADTRVARANLTGVLAQRDALLVSLTSELDAARARIVANRANVTASTEAVNAARAQLQLAEARYKQEIGSQIELADAQTAVTTAEGNLISAEWQLATSWVQLRRALGAL